MLLILVLALLFCPSLAEEELGGVKQKKIQAGHTICKEANLYVKKLTLMITKKKKEKARTFYFDKRPTPKFHSFGSAIPIMIFLLPEGKVFPFLAGCGRGGIRTPDTVVRSHVL